MRREELYPYIQKTHPNICQIRVLQNRQEVWVEAWNGYEKTDWATASLDFLGGKADITGEFSYRIVFLLIRNEKKTV